jgi:hypothetical protein
MDKTIDSLFWIIFAGIAAYFVFRMIRYGGFKAAMFGANIERTAGEVIGLSHPPVSSVLKVHILGGADPEKAVGLEFVAKSIASYQMLPLTLSSNECRKLISLLQSATQGSQAP